MLNGKKKTTEEIYSLRVFRLNYAGNQQNVIARYSSRRQDTIFAPPAGTQHLAHVTYLKEGATVNTNRAGIDYFLITDEKKANLGFNPEFVDVMRKDFYNGEEGTEERHSVDYKIPNSSSQFQDLARRVASFDIWKFHQGKKQPKISSSPRIEFVDKLVGPKPIQAGYALIDGDYGKQAFEPECLADMNLDFAKWCITEVTPDFLLNQEQGCNLCYNKYKHTGYPYYFKTTRENLVKQINELRHERFDKILPTRYLRIAKGTEAGHPMFRKHLKATLEACIETGIKAFMPTKFLEKDEEIAKLFVQSNSVLLISQGNDLFEKGACAYGRTNEVRLQDGLWFLNKGVCAVPYVNVDAREEMGGEFYRERLKRAIELGFPNIQILPVRIRKKEHAHIIGGWQDSKGPRGINLFGQECGGCDVTKDHQRLFNYVHPSLTNLIGDNNGAIRMCHHSGDRSWCGKCFLPGEKGVKVPRAKGIIKKEEDKRPRRKRIRSDEPTLFDMSEI